MIDYGWFIFGMLFIGLFGLAFGLGVGFFLGMEIKLKKQENEDEK